MPNTLPLRYDAFINWLGSLVPLSELGIEDTVENRTHGALQLCKAWEGWLTLIEEQTLLLKNNSSEAERRLVMSVLSSNRHFITFLNNTKTTKAFGKFLHQAFQLPSEDFGRFLVLLREINQTVKLIR